MGDAWPSERSSAGGSVLHSCPGLGVPHLGLELGLIWGDHCLVEMRPAPEAKVLECGVCRSGGLWAPRSPRESHGRGFASVPRPFLVLTARLQIGLGGLFCGCDRMEDSVPRGPVMVT